MPLAIVDFRRFDAAQLHVISDVWYYIRHLASPPQRARARKIPFSSFYLKKPLNRARACWGGLFDEGEGAGEPVIIGHPLVGEAELPAAGEECDEIDFSCVIGRFAASAPAGA